ncbi:MAG: hypothetical protein MUF15_19085 [Acidobacteria bacterium]|nr:hypothetical protein [Acidobacteriota bacterium]
MEKQKRRISKPESSKAIDEDAKISILISSIYYFLDFVFIIWEVEGFRLVVMHNKQLITYRVYKTVKAAKIAFSRIYGSKAWRKGIKPSWSVFYHPGMEWLNERKAIIKKALPELLIHSN